MINDLGHLETKQGQAQIQINFEFISNQFSCLVDIKSNVENKQCPKILQPLLLNSKYSVDHDPPGWRFY